MNMLYGHNGGPPLTLSLELRYYQRNAIDAIYAYFQSHDGNPLVLMPTGCHAKDARILMFDGSVKLVQEVQVGDKLMGPDSWPRTVLQLARGRQRMARIHPVKGEPFVVNMDHILSLKKVKEGSNLACEAERVENVTVGEYAASTNWFRHVRKLRRVGVSFGEAEQPLDPYFVGAMLGDGSLWNGTVQFTCSEPVMAEMIHKTAQAHNCTVCASKKVDNAATDYRISYISGKKNPVYAKLEALGLGRTNSYSVCIPEEYKIASREQRLSVLAGIIDTDGSFSKGGYDITTVSVGLAKDIVFVARSLGFAAYLAEKDATLNGYFVSKAYRVFISGDVNEIPVRIEYKKATPRKQKKDVLCTGFHVEELTEDDFYGFSLSGDHLYLTDDFIVHHNTGKSVVLGGFAFEILQMLVGERIIIGTHSKELVKQNANKLEQMWPGAPIGIHCDGLKRRDVSQPVIYGSIQSMLKNVEYLGFRNLLLIDEAQMVGQAESAEWLLFIRALQVKNPKLKVIGLTATGYREGLGWLTNGPIFTDICYDLTSLEAFNKLLAEGYLAPLVSPRTVVGISSQGIKTASNGDYVQKDAEKASMRVTREALNDAVKYKHVRHSWLVFAGGIEHAEQVAQALTDMGVPACAVHSGNKQFPLKAAEADQRLEDFKAGKYQACVNYGKLTTGFDHPPIDLIVMLRLTKSTVLWVQMLGRGTRPFGGDYYFPPKRDCLVLDYARNIEKLGPINDPVIPRPKGQGAGDPPVKMCPHCDAYNHISARFCDMCGEEFEFSVKVKDKADHKNEPLRDVTPEYREFTVQRAFYRRHKSKQSSLDSFCVSYTVNEQTLPFTEWVHIESQGRARANAEQWWMQRTAQPCPNTIDEALQMQMNLRVPTRLRVHINKQYPEIVGVEYG